MKRYLALMLALLLALTALTAWAEEEEAADEPEWTDEEAYADEAAEDPLTWAVNEDGSLTVWISTESLTGSEWTCSISDPSVMTMLSEEYESDSEDDAATGTWSATLAPVPGSAGIVDLTFTYLPTWSDEPQQTIPVEVYIDGEGTPWVLTVGDTVIQELDF